MRTKYTPRAATLLAMVLLATVSACGDSNSQKPAAAPAREIQLAPAPPAQPQLNDSPATATAAPAPKPVERRPVHVAKAPPRVREPEVIVRRLDAQDTPAVSAPVPVVPAPVAAAPMSVAPTVGTVSAGTSFEVHPVGRVCTNTFKPGDRFTATLPESIAGSDGAVIPAGAAWC
jgi:hypothetical protein